MTINAETLYKHLFSNMTRVYAVLDGASVPDLPMKLFEMKPPHFCLFSGELEPDMAYVAPYLVKLSPQTPFTDWLLTEFWGNHWGILIHSRQPLSKMRKHFRSLVTAYDEKGNPMIFRFYDPRVLNKFLPTCDGEQLQTFFENIEFYFSESEDQKNLNRFQFGDEGLNKTLISAV